MQCSISGAKHENLFGLLVHCVRFMRNFSLNLVTTQRASELFVCL
jgi:hypothetical protein